MSDVLNKASVLVLNRNWQAINVRTPADAFCSMAAGTATALEVKGEEDIRPLTWAEWIQLPIRPQDSAVLTVRGPIRIPNVIVAVNYTHVPLRRPTLNARAIRERDGNRCQYTGQLLRTDEGSIDHVLPRSRGGKDTWDNCVWASKDINNHKGNRTPHEAGLKLMRSPRPPAELPVTAFIKNYSGIADWKFFVAD
ncbi:MAG: HNH endonuclease [Verrucomicrobia bacterium]|nr:HNH endonuclease [Verrucomicrobiota bacterium]